MATRTVRGAAVEALVNRTIANTDAKRMRQCSVAPPLLAPPLVSNRHIMGA